MAKSLKRTDDVDVFDYGKAVTLILSQTKELHKTHNELVDDIKYLEARKQQEIQDLERVIAEKAEILKLKQELTNKIIAKKSEFEANVNVKREELALKEANLTAREADLIENTKQIEADLKIRSDELKLRSSDFKKEIQTSMDSLNQREAALIDREEKVAQTKTTLESDQARASLLTTKLEKDTEAYINKKLELDNREAAIASKENELEKQRQHLAGLTADLEGQASLIESEKSKNKTDMEAIRTIQSNLYAKKAELDNREIHLRDREATALSH